jgi:catechol 2,3-dioxygenase-like lactoylglutathione lyase family enzyme
VLTGFDHVTIAVNDAHAAIAAYERLLGSAPTWRGQHPELGTEVALFGLSNALIELVAPRSDAVEAEGLRALLEARGEGLQAIALGTADASACSAALRERGVRATAPEPGEARSTDGAVRRYRTVELSTRTTRGLHVLAVERSDGASLRQRTTPAASAVDALDHVVIRTADADAAIALYERGLGIRLALDRELGSRRMLFFRIGGVTLEVVHDPALGEADSLYGLAYRVRDIDAAHERMCASGLAVSEVRKGNKPGTRVFTVREGTCGVPTLILRDPARDRGAPGANGAHGSM